LGSKGFNFIKRKKEINIKKFKIAGSKVKGSNKNDDGNSVKKHYKGTYNPSTREINLRVTYEDSQESTYTGILGLNGRTTTLNLEVTKKGSGPHVGDKAIVSGFTSWN
jgi:hypothetical protein